jgi:hypothetical protein
VIAPGDEIHYVAVLDEQGNTLETVPLSAPIVVPRDADKASIKARVQIDVTITGGT